MLQHLLRIAAITCVGLTGCSAMPGPLAGTTPSPQYDGLYSGAAQLTHFESPGCGSVGDFTSRVDVRNGYVMWHTGSTQPYDMVLVRVPVASNGSFQDYYGSRILTGQINGKQMSVVSDSGACRVQMSLTKVKTA